MSSVVIIGTNVFNYPETNVLMEIKFLISPNFFKL